jgi:hypothetical protein
VRAAQDASRRDAKTPRLAAFDIQQSHSRDSDEQRTLHLAVRDRSRVHRADSKNNRLTYLQPNRRECRVELLLPDPAPNILLGGVSPDDGPASLAGWIRGDTSEEGG